MPPLVIVRYSHQDELPGDLLENPATRGDAARVLWDRYPTDRRLFFVGDVVGRFSVLTNEAKALLCEVAADEVPLKHLAQGTAG